MAFPGLFLHGSKKVEIGTRNMGLYRKEQMKGRLYRWKQELQENRRLQ